MIYVLSIGPGKWIKIGYTSKSLSERVAQLQTGCPFEITPLFCIEGNILQEKEIHKALEKVLAMRGLPRCGEWYPGKRRIVKTFLDHLRYGCNMGLAFLDNDNVNGIRNTPSASKAGMTRKQKERLRQTRRGQKQVFEEAKATRRKRVKVFPEVTALPS